MLEYQLGQALPFHLMNGEPAREPGIAVLKSDDETLFVTAVMTDSDIFNRAEKHNEETWKTGDALEFFFQPKGRLDYYELHVTPNLKTLQLHIPRVELLRTTPFEDKFFESGFKYSVDIQDGQWIGRMEIPLAALGNAKLIGSRFTISRYNYNKQWGDTPEMSTISLFANGTFHSPDEWFTIRDNG